MQKLIIIVIAAGLLGSCKKHDGNDGGHQGADIHGISLALLKVDYQTHKFEGGKILHFTLNGNIPQNVPVQMLYVPPGDFGNITLLHAPTGDSIFDGSIVWNGKGQMKYPATLDTGFPTVATAVPAPDSNDVQIISPNTFITKEDYHIPEVWEPVSKLLVTQQYSIFGNKKPALFLYMPSVGTGNPADWDYFWLLYPAGPILTTLEQ